MRTLHKHSFHGVYRHWFQPAQLTLRFAQRLTSTMSVNGLATLAEYTSVIITNLVFAKWSHVFVDPKLTTALLDRLTYRCNIVKTGNESYRFRHSSTTAKVSRQQHPA